MNLKRDLYKSAEDIANKFPYLRNPKYKSIVLKAMREYSKLSFIHSKETNIDFLEWEQTRKLTDEH